MYSMGRGGNKQQIKKLKEKQKKEEQKRKEKQ